MDKPTISEVLSAVTDKQVEKAQARVKKPRGRPKTEKRKAKETQEFIENYDHNLPYRPEPVALVAALSLPADEQKQALEDALSPRQRAFCREYVLDYNQREAAIRAGYSPAGAAGTAHNLMQYRGILRLIEIYTESKAQKITAVDPDWVISKITEIVTNDDARHGDKLRGLELLAKHLGMFIERTEISGRDGEAIKIEETKQQASEVARKIREMGKRAGLSVVK
jgi:phage terminase small subunit